MLLPSQILVNNNEDQELQFLTQEQLDQLELTEEENNSRDCMIYEEELKE